MTIDEKCIFSIITPVYNRAELIIQTLESVRAQDYRPIEYVVVDDGSTDASVEVVRRWIAALPQKEGHESDNFQVRLVTQPNGGVSSARNRGLQHISGDYVYFLDSDDLMEPGALKALVKKFKETDADFIFAGFRRFDDDTGKILMEKIPKGDENLVSRALQGALWGNAGRISLTVSFAQAIGTWNEEFQVFEDREYSERAILLAKNPAVLPYSLVRVRTGGGPRQNDLLRSRMGRGFRIRSETSLANLACTRSDIAPTDWSDFRSRIYGLSMRSYAEGWREHGMTSRQLAASIPALLTRKGHMRRAAVFGGVFGCRIYLLLSKGKKILRF